MKSIARAVISLFCVIALGGFSPCSSAQQTPSANQEEIDRIREYLDPIRGARVVGSSESLAIQLPNGELIRLAPNDGCLPPESRGGLVKVDCSRFDGPTYYFDESTREIIEACSFWFPDLRRCPPKQWPIEVPGCAGRVPQTITGTWRFYAIPTASGFWPTDGGWTMTLADGSITFDLYGFAQVERSYTVVERDDQRYSLKIRDGLTETAVDIELAPCGLLVEGQAVCDAFCKNIASEVGTPTDAQLREIVARSLGDRFDEDTVERILESIPDAAQQQQPQPLFPERAFFLEVTNDRR
jgi:hypothetical protein